jgi:ParB family chromosome partitioning protein
VKTLRSVDRCDELTAGTEGSGSGTVHKVCANPSCPVHHPKPQSSSKDENWKADQEKQHREQAIANTTGP